MSGTTPQDRDQAVRVELLTLQGLVEYSQSQVVEARTRLNMLNDDLGSTLLGTTESSLSRIASALRSLVGKVT